MFRHLLHLMSFPDTAEFLHADRTVSLLLCLLHATATHIVDATNIVQKNVERVKRMRMGSVQFWQYALIARLSFAYGCRNFCTQWLCENIFRRTHLKHGDLPLCSDNSCNFPISNEAFRRSSTPPWTPPH